MVWLLNEADMSATPFFPQYPLPGAPGCGGWAAPHACGSGVVVEAWLGSTLPSFAFCDWKKFLASHFCGAGISI